MALRAPYGFVTCFRVMAALIAPPLSMVPLTSFNVPITKCEDLLKAAYVFLTFLMLMQ